MDMTDNKSKQEKDCPYCGKSYSSQGIHTHVQQSKGNGHGPHGEVPEDFDVDSLKPSNKKPRGGVTHSRAETSTRHLYLCNWCNELCKGERGYKIHLGKSRDDPLHPEDASIEDEQYTLIPADDEWNPFMDLEDVYQIQDRRRRRGAFDSSAERPIDTVSEDVEEQIATLLSKNSEFVDDPERVMSIFDCDRETFEEGKKLAAEHQE